MKYQRILTFIGLLAAATGTRCFAQEAAVWQIGGALPIALNNLKDYTNQPFFGFCVEASYQRTFPDSKTKYRFGSGLNYFPGKELEAGGRKVSLAGLQANIDIVVPIGKTYLSLITGASVNTWFKSVSGRDTFDPSMNNNVSGIVDNPFGKLGFRFGLEYIMDSQFSVSALFQMTELGTDNEFLKGGAPDRGRQTVNPAWVQLGLSYKF
ncbi:MAG: hypothetical protein LBB40_05915 [Holophagales bacterium]|jgi:hypothetical protein|nr:hypothetical protein [Holophagales bacterium]